MNNLKYYRLLRDSMFECWNEWLKLAGVKDTPSNKGIIINDINVAILAGVGGQNVALGFTIFYARPLGD